MKRILITLIAGLSVLTAFGQEKKGEDMEQRFFDAKIREFVYILDIKDSQKPDFVAVYKRYNDEMRAAIGKKEKPLKRPETAEAAAAALKSRLENQNKAQEIRIKYVDDFAKVLEPGQLLRLYDVESQIQHKLMNRQGGHGDKMGGKGKGKGFNPEQGRPSPHPGNPGPRPGIRPSAEGHDPTPEA